MIYSSRKNPFKAKFGDYHISAIKFFSPELTKPSLGAKKILEILYTVPQPEKICNNMFAFFQIAASFLPDVVCFGTRR